MWKQFLNKLPRKNSKSDTGSESVIGQSSNNGSGAAVVGDANQRTGDGNVVPSKSGVIKRMSSAVFPSSNGAGMEPFVAFRDVSDADKQNLFISKMNMCCVVFDFSDLDKNSAEKDMKRQVLLDLIDYVDNGTARYSEQMISGACRMFAINLFRTFPPSFRTGAGGGETEEEEPVFDPSWPHLQLVYDLLLKLIASSLVDAKIAKKYVDHSFILRLLDLFESEDPRERDCLKTILHRVYGKFMVHRPFIRKTVSNILYRFVFETDRHNGIAELLEVFGSVISGFALPLKEEHKLFLWKALIPLHKPKTLGAYAQQLNYCVTQYIEKEPKLASSVVSGLLKYWPITSSQKEVMFLSELEEVLEVTNLVELQNCMVPLFRRIAYCVNSSHFQVAERALFLLNNDHMISLVAQNRQVTMPLIIPALERNSRNHWNQAVLNMTLNVKKMLSDMDEELFQVCQREFQEQEEKQLTLEEKRRITWECLEKAAAFQPVTGNTPVMVRPSMPAPITTHT